MSHLRLLRTGLFAAALLTTSLPGAARADAPPAWWSYSRPATFGSVRQSVRVPMRDGVRLACRLTRPARGGAPAPGSFPGIVYEVTPYEVLDPFFVEQGDFFARRGYNALTCTIRGAGSSGGAYPQINQPAEQTDAYDLVEWLAVQAFSDGRIGQSGESYGAMSSYRAAAAQPPHLRAIAPQQAPNDLYLDDIYPGGVPTQPLLRQLWPAIGQLASLGRIDAARLWAVQRAHPLHDDFWDQIAIDGVLDRVQVPVLAFAGWDDQLFRDGSVRNIERLVARGHGDRTWLIDGPWAHSYVIDWQSCRVVTACIGFQRVPPGALLAWFDHWVAQVPGAPLPASHFTSFQTGPGGAGWRELGDVRVLQRPPVTWALNGAGRSGGDGGLAPAPAGPARAPWNATPLQGATERVDAVTFTSGPLPEARVLLGRPVVKVRAEADAPDALLHATLRLRTGAADRVIGDAWLRAALRDSLVTPAPLVPGSVFTARIVLPPLDRTVPAGSTLQLRLDSGSATVIQPLQRRVRVTLRTGEGGSTLTLPLH